MDLSPERPFGNAQLARAVGIEATEPVALHQSVTDRIGAVLGGEHGDLVLTPAQTVSRLHFDDGKWKPGPLDPDRQRAAQDPLGAFRAIEGDGLGAVHQPHRAEQPDHTEEVVGVKVGKEDLPGREAHPVAHHLTLGALAASNSKVPLAVERDDATLRSTVDGGAGAEESEDNMETR